MVSTIQVSPRAANPVSVNAPLAYETVRGHDRHGSEHSSRET
jgi:hypothetical protein